MPRTRKPGTSGRGGPRQGTPGRAYTNRSDLTQAPTAAPNQPYGQAGQQLASQQAVPLPKVPPVAAPSPAQSPGSATVGGPAPGSLGQLHDPTQRPNEPLTAGMPTGPGPGAEALAPPDPLAKAAAVLNTLGGTADPTTAALRTKINATLNNRGAA